MKGRLITIGIMSLILSILTIITIIQIIGNVHATNNVESNKNIFEHIKSIGVLWIFGLLLGLAIGVMGIVTLAMKKSDSAKGLTITSGVLSIISCIPILGALIGILLYPSIMIVSFIGVSKIKN